MANRKKTDESCRHSLSLKRHLWSSSSEDEDEKVTSAGACRTTACRNPHTSPSENDVFTQSSSLDEQMYGSRCQEPCTRNVPSTLPKNRLDSVEQAIGQDAVLRRDNNPFSFKAFLKNGMQQTNYHNTGARPKVYTSPTSSPSSILNKDNSSNVYSNRNPTELPDFVQDHLVIEQCYLNHEATQPVLPDVDNLPDFALNSMEQRQSRLRNESKKNDTDALCEDLRSFDLTGTLHKDLPHREHSMSNTIHTNHLDLPTFENRRDETLPDSEHNNFPFSLSFGKDRILSMKSNPSVNATAREGPLPGNETSVHKSLPDFLSDGPMHNRSADPEPARMTESAEIRLLLENETLRQELETARRQISEKTERIRLLETELLSKKEVEHEETAHLEKAMEQVEDNLKRSTKRAVNAESTVTSLKKEIKALTTEISLLRLENSELRAGVSSIRQSGSNVGAGNKNRTARRLAHDLFTAASSAELSLRQLMSGVENLRVLASTLENMDRIEDWTKDFLPDSDEDNAAGPAV